MPTQKDYYSILGIGRDAQEDDIKKAYRTLAKKYHPDVSKEPNAEEKFKEVQEAYDVLSDPQKKANYDKYGTADPNEQFGGGAGGFSGFSGFSDFSDLGDIFSSFFGTGSSRQQSSRPLKGQDIQKKMSISLNDVIFGRKASFSIPVYETCDNCHGSGAEKESDIISCPKCDGRGSILTEVQTIFGRTQSRVPCPDCNGTGKYIRNKCHVCKGDGRIKIQKNVDVNIPIGIATGQQIKLAGFGGKGYNGGANGDLYLMFVVKDDSTYKRNGDDLSMEVPISFTEAALGTKKYVDTPYGPDIIQINEGTQTGSVFRIRGKGVPNIKTRLKGDLYVKVKLETPKNLTEEQKELLRQLDGAEPKSSIFGKKRK